MLQPDNEIGAQRWDNDGILAEIELNRNMGTDQVLLSGNDLLIEKQVEQLAR